MATTAIQGNWPYPKPMDNPPPTKHHSQLSFHHTPTRNHPQQAVVPPPISMLLKPTAKEVKLYSVVAFNMNLKV